MGHFSWMALYIVLKWTEFYQKFYNDMEKFSITTVEKIKLNCCTKLKSEISFWLKTAKFTVKVSFRCKLKPAILVRSFASSIYWDIIYTARWKIASVLFEQLPYFKLVINKLEIIKPLMISFVYIFQLNNIGI